MNIQKKRIFIYFIFISFGVLLAFLFLRKNNPALNNATTPPIEKKDSIIEVSLLSEFFDLENNNENFVSNEKALSGKNSCRLSSSVEYGITSNKLVENIPSFKSLKSISIKFHSLFEKDDPDALYVLAIDNSKGENVFWDGKSIPFSKTNEWQESKITFQVSPDFLIPGNRITIYPWNRNKKIFYLDDISIDFVGTEVYKEKAISTSENSNLLLDFETTAGFSAADNAKETTAHSGKRACELFGGKEYGPALNKTFLELGAAFPKTVSMSMWIYPLSDNPNTVLVTSVVNSKNETVFWEGKSTENKAFPKNTWSKINALFKLPVEKFNPEDVLGVSVWNKGKTDVIIDDIEVVYGEGAPRRGEESKIDPVSIYEKRFVSEKNKPPFKTIWMEKQEIGKELTAFSSNDFFVAANFNNDVNNIDELLCISKNKQAMYAYDESLKTFKKIWENINPTDQLWNMENTYLASSNNGKTSITIQQQNKALNYTLIFNGEKWTREKEQRATLASSSQASPISLYSGNFTSDKNQTLKLDKSWRFDLKLIENDVILGNVDFKGYQNDYNPKYYEFVKLVPGNFISKNKTSLLVIMCNCTDPNFVGDRCKQIEDLPFLPNSVQLYNFSPQITQIITDKN